MDLANDLRPRFLNEYIGQENLKKKLEILIESCKRRETSLDHMLFHGQPGLGKTTLSRIIAKEIGADLKSTSAPIIDKIGDLAAILMSLNSGDILFIDEIHRLKKPIEELLYSAMEDRYIDIMLGKGPTAKSMRIDLNSFTLVGATTKMSFLSAPLRDRFGFIHRLEYYNKREIALLLKKNSTILGLELLDGASVMLSNISRGTPRIANKYLRRARDIAEVKGVKVIDSNIVTSMMSLMGIDELGLDSLDIKILSLIVNRYSGGPVGVDTIAASLGEDRKSLESVHEPYLVKMGLIERTRSGRKITDLGYEHLSKKGIYK